MTSSKCRPRNGAGRVLLTESHYQKLLTHLQQIRCSGLARKRQGWKTGLPERCIIRVPRSHGALMRIADSAGAIPQAAAFGPASLSSRTAAAAFEIWLVSRHSDQPNTGAASFPAWAAVYQAVGDAFLFAVLIMLPVASPLSTCTHLVE